MNQRQLTASKADIDRLYGAKLTFRTVKGGFRCNQAPHLGVLSKHRKNELLAKTAARPASSTRRTEAPEQEQVTKAPPRRATIYSFETHYCPYCHKPQPLRAEGLHKCYGCGLTYKLVVLPDDDFEDDDYYLNGIEDDDLDEDEGDDDDIDDLSDDGLDDDDLGDWDDD